MSPRPQVPAGIRTIALVGLRASGKSTVGRELAARLGWPFVDGDERLGAVAGRPAGHCLAEWGEAVFRDLEEAIVLAELASPGPRVLATGGGAVTRSAVRAALREATCATVWLQVAEATLVARLQADPTPRPALTAAPDVAAEVALLAARRRPLYAAVARLTMAAMAPAAEVAAAILTALAAR